jgi:predicted metal-dependent peptidase
MQGKLPAGLERLIGDLLRPTLPLDQVLMQFLTEDKQDYSMLPPDRRFAAEDLFLPDLFSEETLKDMVVCMDTSGSMGEEELRRDLSEIAGLMRHFPEIEGHLFVGDAAVQHVGDLSRLPAKSELKGGGGTDFRPFFKEVVDRKLSPVCMVFFTDGYGSYPEKAPGYPVIWVLSSEYEVPWGMSLKYSNRR